MAVGAIDHRDYNGPVQVDGILHVTRLLFLIPLASVANVAKHALVLSNSWLIGWRCHLDLANGVASCVTGSALERPQLKQVFMCFGVKFTSMKTLFDHGGRNLGHVQIDSSVLQSNGQRCSQWTGLLVYIDS
jgi:hypothetical protein